jgi:hypothetical protein
MTRRVIFVIGTHRSGTSLLTHALQFAGASIGKTPNKDRDWQNPDGYFENDAFHAFHEKMLEKNGASWHTVPRLELEYTQQDVEEYRNLINHEFEETSNLSQLCVIKDPRLTFFAKMLIEVCRENFSYGFVFLHRYQKDCIESLVKAQNIPYKVALTLYEQTMSAWDIVYQRVLTEENDPTRSRNAFSCSPRAMSVDHHDVVSNLKDTVKRISDHFCCGFSDTLDVSHLVKPELHRFNSVPKPTTTPPPQPPKPPAPPKDKSWAQQLNEFNEKEARPQVASPEGEISPVAQTELKRIAPSWKKGGTPDERSVFYEAVKPKCLAVLLFHNDADLIQAQIDYYRFENRHDIIIFDHASTDNSHDIYKKNKDEITCLYELPEGRVDFKNNEVHELIYSVLQGNIPYFGIKVTGIQMHYSAEYDWISFPESDEFLEGPDRSLDYFGHLCVLHPQANINKIKFDNYIFWFTEKDDKRIKSPTKRIKHYSLKRACAERLYAWRGHHTISRFFGHVHPRDIPSEITTWKTRHYEMRSEEHLRVKIEARAGVPQTFQNSPNKMNHHYEIMARRIGSVKDYGIIAADELHYDDGISELIDSEKYPWSQIY